MRYFFLIVGLLVVLNINAQKINKLGKIDFEELHKAADHEVRKGEDKYKVYADSLVFEGNSYYKVPNGYITSLEVFDESKDYVKQYDTNGKLLVTIFSERIINLKISKDGNHLAYFNSENIILIDMVKYTADTLQGSFVYNFLDDNSFIYYNADQKTINYKSYSVEVDDYPSQFLEFKDKLLVLTKKSIFDLSGGVLMSLYGLEGELFDAKVKEGKFYFIDKVEKRKSEAYTMYKTSDFMKVIIQDKLDDLNF